MARVRLQALLATVCDDWDAAAEASAASADLSPVSATVKYLASPEAVQSIEANLYWPKWNSPWWHLATLFEMGLSHLIPPGVASRLAVALREQNLPLFFQAELPHDRDPKTDTPCPCSLGNIYQILTAAGVDLDVMVPWARPWLLRYQMPEGGFSCDEDAYQAAPQASSMVGTIAPLEAILNCTHRPFTAAEARFLDRGAQCLIQRELRLGCDVPFNAEERLDEADWLKPCFPRFYLYDVLRGLRFLLQWSETRKLRLPAQSVVEVVAALCQQSTDGQIRIGRRAYEGIGTRMLSPAGVWQRQPEASHFPLLDQISQPGTSSPYLTRQWRQCRAQLVRLIDLKLVI